MNAIQRDTEEKRRETEALAATLTPEQHLNVARELAEDVNAARLGRDHARYGESRAIAERDAERALSDALAEALRAFYESGHVHISTLEDQTNGLAVFSGQFTGEGGYTEIYDETVPAVLSRYDAQRGAK